MVIACAIFIINEVVLRLTAKQELFGLEASHTKNGHAERTEIWAQLENRPKYRLEISDDRLFFYTGDLHLSLGKN